MRAQERRPGLAVAASSRAIAQYLVEELDRPLGNSLDIMPLEPGISDPGPSIDLVLLADPALSDLERERLLPPRLPWIEARYTLTREAWYEALSTGRRIRTVDSPAAGLFRDACQNCGLLELEIVPGRQGAEWDISAAKLSVSTLANLFWMFGRNERFDIERIRTYMETVHCIPEDSRFLLFKELELEERFTTALQSLEYGTVHFDGDGYVILAQDYADPGLNQIVHRARGLPIEEAWDGLSDVINGMRSGKETTVTVDGETLLARLEPVNSETARGGVIVFRRFGAAEARAGGRTADPTEGNEVGELVGESRAMACARNTIHRVARTDLPVLISGESGTGKELAARAIHAESARADGPLVTVNCATLKDSLLESELFGYEAGAFTGADRRGKSGLLRRAHQGTLLLDEIEELSAQGQASLLRAVENGTVIPVGATDGYSVDVRLIALTNQPLDSRVKQGEFRLDLYYRIAAVTLEMPSLRARSEDIPALAQHFADACGTSGAIDTGILDRLGSYSWPGNVRELKHCIEWLVLMGQDIQNISSPPPSVRHALETAGQDGSAESGREKPGDASSDEVIEYVLGEIAQLNRRGRAAGRRTLLRALHADQVLLSERRLREILHEVHERGWIERRTAHSGVFLTQIGQERAAKCEDRRAF